MFKWENKKNNSAMSHVLSGWKKTFPVIWCRHVPWVNLSMGLCLVFLHKMKS